MMAMPDETPVAHSLKRFSVQVIDNRRIPLSMIETDEEEEARAEFDKICSAMPQRHIMLCFGSKVIAERQQLTRYGKY